MNVLLPGKRYLHSIPVFLTSEQVNAYDLTMRTIEEAAESTVSMIGDDRRKYLSLGIPAVAFLTFVIWTNWNQITNPLTETGDVAADSLMSMSAWTQSDGHYSRWGYNHPGPLLLWLDHLSELILPWLPPFGAHLVMSALLVTLSVTFLAAALQDLSNVAWLGPLSFTVASVALSDGTVLIPYGPTMGNWFFVLAGAGLMAVIREKHWGYPVALFAGAALVHLHLLYVPLGVLTIAVLTVCWRIGHGFPSTVRRPWFLVVATSAIGTIMALPILLDLALRESDWIAYFATERQLSDGAYRSATEAIFAFLEVLTPATRREVLVLSLSGAAFAICLVVGLLIVIVTSDQQWSKMGAWVGLIGFLYLFALSRLDFVTPISFGRSLPFFAFMVLVATAVPRFAPRKAAMLVLVAVLVLTLVSVRASRLAAGRSAAGTAEAAISKYEAFRRRAPNAVLVISHETDPRLTYLGAAATALLAARKGYPFCVASNEWPYWIEPRHICGAGSELRFRIHFTSPVDFAPSSVR